MTARGLYIVIFGLSLAVSTLLGGMLAADHLYERAVADCAAYGGTPAAIDDRLAYTCATPYGRIDP